MPEQADLLKNSGTLVERRDVAVFIELEGQIEVALLDAVEIWHLQTTQPFGSTEVGVGRIREIQIAGKMEFGCGIRVWNDE